MSLSQGKALALSLVWQLLLASLPAVACSVIPAGWHSVSCETYPRDLSFELRTGNLVIPHASDQGRITKVT